MFKLSLPLGTIVFCCLLLFSQQIIAQQVIDYASLPFLNTTLSFEQRASDLVSRLTLEEKVGQMQHTAPAIERLNIPAYNWWNECLHGVGRNGVATVFPQAIGMAATWNPQLIEKEADVISTEARAKYYEAIRNGSHDIYQGLTFWSPNINIFRDPRWGRGQETYGEDPFLTASIGTAFVRGLQGYDSNYFKVIATAKHFAVHSGPEPLRHSFDAWPSQRDLYETYLPAFDALVNKAKVYSVMTCYNRVFGVPSSASTFLFSDILRNKWRFKGYVVSDCWAISDMYNFHHFVNTAEQAAALSVKAGTDLSCGPEYGSLINAVKLGYISENEIDVAVYRLFLARFRLGLFDPPQLVSYSSISPSAYNTPENNKLARQLAREAVVLLRNNNNVLPVSKRVSKILVTGPYIADTNVLLGNYNGIPTHPVTLLQGISNAAENKIKILSTPGATMPEQTVSLGAVYQKTADSLLTHALFLAKTVDLIVVSAGISPRIEGEEMDVKIPGFAGGDRTSIELPENQKILIRELIKTGKPVVLILTNGGAISIPEKGQGIAAIIEAWYPGQEGGNAVADVIFGKYNPAGRLPVTFYASDADLPAFDDYSMEGRTYKYFRSKALYEFGFGLSYSTFDYLNFGANNLFVTSNDTIRLRLVIKNTGKYDGDEVVQLYFRQPDHLKEQPIRALVGFKRESFKRGESKEISFEVPVSDLKHYDPRINNFSIAKGMYTFEAGASSSDFRQKLVIEVR